MGWGSSNAGMTWKPVSSSKDALLPARAAHAVVHIRRAACHMLVMLAGMSEDGPLRDVWQSWDGGTTWRAATLSAPWTARSGAAAVAIQQRQEILLLGGFDGVNYLSDIWITLDCGETWSQIDQ